MRRARSLAVIAASVLLVTAACTGSAPATRRGTASTTAATVVGGATPSTALRWRSCGAIECATLAVPLDRARPAGPKIRLALYRRRATRGARVGALLVNPGGPGASGRSLVESAGELFPRGLRERFDVVGWDPRGVGASTAVRCGQRLDAFYAAHRAPDSATEVVENVAVARRLARECAARSGALLAQVGTADSVQDMDAIRAALGEARLTYLGFSYGTYLGARYAVAYPAKVRAMVLDGAIDPGLDPLTATVQQSAGFEGSLRAFLADCSTSRSCPFRSGGRAASGLRRLLAQIDAEPLYARTGGELRALGPSEATLGIATALYSGRASWGRLAGALAAAAAGDGSALLAFADAYSERARGGTYSNAQAAFYAISCADGQGPASLAEVRRTAAAAARVAPVLGPMNAWLGLPCAYWPVQPTAPPAPVTRPRGLATIVVVAATRDPATPLAWGRSLARQLGARLVTADSDAHTAFLGAAPCVQRPVVEYLVRARAPRRDVACR